MKNFSQTDARSITIPLKGSTISQFQVFERNGVTHSGYVDEGWKDTVLLMPGERIKILVRFEDYAGLSLYHCHNLEHEDMGMMRNYLIENATSSKSPINA
jgi:hypothetical protein